MGRNHILIISSRDSIRELFTNAIDDSSCLIFAGHRPEIRRILSSENVVAAIADNQVSLTSGADILKWIRENHPWVDLIYLQPETEQDPKDQKDIYRFAYMVKQPLSINEAKELIEMFLGNGEGPLVTEEIDATDKKDEDTSTDRDLVESITAFIDTLPALPFVVQKIIALIHRDDTSAKDIAEVISLDTALAARVLRLVNSALYSIANAVTTIEHAVALLGFSEVRNLALGLKVVEALPQKNTTGLDRNAFWEHSLACGLCARHMAEVKPYGISPDEAFLGGLFHDVGKLVLDDYLGDKWSETQQLARSEGISPLTAEEKIFGVAHTIVGEWLAKRWKLPHLYQLAISYHHDLPVGGSYSQEETLFCEIIRASNALIQWMNLGSSGFTVLNYLSKDEMELLNLNEAELTDILLKTELNLANWKQILGLQEKTVSPYGSLGPSGDAADSRSRELWCVTPTSQRVPSLKTLLSTLGYKVYCSHWGENLIEVAAYTPHRAILLDLRGVKVEPEKLISFLKALRNKSEAPVLVLSPTGAGLTDSLKDKGIVTIRQAARRDVLARFLGKVLPSAE